MSLRAVLRAIQRNWILLVATIVVCTLAGFAVALITPSKYQTDTQILFQPASTSTGTTSASTATAAQSAALGVITAQVPTYAALVTTASVLDPAASSLGDGQNSVDLKRDVSAQVVENTSIVTITTTADTAQGAAKLANAVGTSLVRQVGALDPSGGDTVSVKGSVVESPIVPAGPASPSLVLDILIGFAVGLVLAYLLITAREALRASSGRPSDA